MTRLVVWCRFRIEIIHERSPGVNPLIGFDLRGTRRAGPRAQRRGVERSRPAQTWSLHYDQETPPHHRLHSEQRNCGMIRNKTASRRLRRDDDVLLPGTHSTGRPSPRGIPVGDRPGVLAVSLKGMVYEMNIRVERRRDGRREKRVQRSLVGAQECERRNHTQMAIWITIMHPKRYRVLFGLLVPPCTFSPGQEALQACVDNVRCSFQQVVSEVEITPSLLEVAVVDRAGD